MEATLTMKGAMQCNRMYVCGGSFQFIWAMSRDALKVVAEPEQSSTTLVGDGQF